MKNLTAIYWVKNEAPYLPEYIEFHLLQGFDYFIFYDNDSTDNTKEVLRPYISNGIAEIRHYPPEVKERKNFWLMSQCIDEQKEKSKWIHFHAIDERTFCPDGRSIVDFLKDYESYGGVSVAWKLFNSDGHLTKPKGLVIENYSQTVEDIQFHVKTIIQPLKTSSRCPNDPHNFFFLPGFCAVNENFVKVPGPFMPHDYSMNKIRNHHYVTFSKEEWDNKNNKGTLDHVGMENKKRPEVSVNDLRFGIQWEYMHYPEHIKNRDETLKSFAVNVKANIEKRYNGNEEILSYIGLK